MAKEAKVTGFTQGFAKHVSEGDSITCVVDGLEVRATLYLDDDTTAPDKREDCFWPSLDPKKAGYIGPKSKSTLAREMAKAKEIMRAWQDDEWQYYGLVLTVYKEGIRLTGKWDHALWGIDGNHPYGNHPYGNHAYFTDVANQLLDEAIDDAKDKLVKLCSAQKRLARGAGDAPLGADGYGR